MNKTEKSSCLASGYVLVPVLIQIKILVAHTQTALSPYEIQLLHLTPQTGCVMAKGSVSLQLLL